MKVKNQLHVFGNALLDIFYPNQCQICAIDLTLNEKHVCLSCSYDLPYIVQNKNELQQLEKLFWGRVDVENVFSLLNYQKGNQTQKILHQLKYQGKTKLGNYFGEVLGSVIPQNLEIDAILPIPLHPKKEKIRGFNQSKLIADGIGKEISAPVNIKWLKRNSFNDSQTKFTKYDRWDNVRKIFSITNPSKLKGKHVLLVDDVLTTGATIESCVAELLKIENCSVSIATLAARI